MECISVYIAVFVLLSIILLCLKQFLFNRKDTTNIKLFYQDTELNRRRLSSLPYLTRNYTPPLLLRYGIASFLTFGTVGRFGSRQTYPIRSRERVSLPDGTTTVFDLYLDPIRKDPLLENVMIVVLPGIMNHSGSDYIISYIEYASSQGFKVACYNHYGSLPDEAINSEAPRFPSYGGTGDISVMMDVLIEKYPDMKYIGVGFSLGANILLKYLGEQPQRQSHFLCAQSWCQGYHAGKCMIFENSMSYLSMLFIKLLAYKQKSIIKTRYLDKLYSPASLNSHKTAVPESSDSPPISNELPSWVHTYARVKGRKRSVSDPTRDDNGYLIDGWEDIPPFNHQQFRNSSFMDSVDVSFSCPLLGFKNLEDFYNWNSSYSYMDQIVDLPVLLVNPRNDYVVRWRIVEAIVEDYCKRTNENAIGVMPEYGGHLGFFQGSSFAPQRISWLDEVSIQHAKSILNTHTCMEYISVYFLVLSLFSIVLLCLKQFVFTRKDASTINIQLIYKDTSLNRERLSSLPLFTRSYIPPFLLSSGIVSILTFAIVCRFGSRQTKPIRSRERVSLPDGTTTVFDLYLDPIRKDPLLENVMIVVLPGIMNHSGSDYIISYIEYASSQGFKVACYNHYGSLPDEAINSEAPRFPSYGGTGDISVMMDVLIEKYPDMKYIGVGFSLGANILLKYLGEQPQRQSHFLCAQSWCQGYHAGKFKKMSYTTWFFYKLIYAKQKSIIKTNYLDKLYSPASLNSHKTAIPESSDSPPISNELPTWVHTYARVKDRKRSVSDPSRDDNGYLIDGWEDIPPFNHQQFRNSSFMDSLDVSFSCPLLGFKNLEDFYNWTSSYSYMDQIVDLPVLLVNTKNDHLVDWLIVEDIIEDYCKRTNENAIGVMPEYGGHLGFFQGSFFAPQRISWLDEVSIQHAKSIVLSLNNQSNPME